MTTYPANLPFPIPMIVCPLCGAHMHLSTIIPDRKDRECMTFVCECGFDYQESATAALERGR